MTRKLLDFARRIARLPRGVLWFTLIAVAVHAQTPQIFTYNPSLSLVPMFQGGGGCTLGNTSPQVGAQSLTFTVNLTCNQGNDTVTGTVQVSFFPTSLTVGDIDTGELTTTLNVSASANLISTGSGISQSSLIVEGGPYICPFFFPSSNPENASGKCNPTNLTLDPSGHDFVGVLLNIVFTDETPTQTYSVKIVFDAAPSTAKGTIAFAVVPSGPLAGKTDVFPPPGDAILGDSTQLDVPPFFALANYSLSSQPTGQVVLQIADQKGNPISGLPSTGPPVKALLGNFVAGSFDGCIGAARTAPGSTCLYYPAPADSILGTGVTALQLTAVLQDSAGNSLATSQPILYPVQTPFVRLTLGSGATAQTFTPIPNGTALVAGQYLSIEIPNPTIKVEYTYPGVQGQLRIYDSSFVTQPLLFGVGHGGDPFSTPQTVQNTSGTLTLYVPVDGKVGTSSSNKTVTTFFTLFDTGHSTYAPPGGENLDVPIQHLDLGTITISTGQVQLDTATPIAFTFPVSYDVAVGGVLQTTIDWGDGSTKTIVTATLNPSVNGTAPNAASHTFSSKTAQAGVSAESMFTPSGPGGGGLQILYFPRVTVSTLDVTVHAGAGQPLTFAGGSATTNSSSPHTVTSTDSATDPNPSSPSGTGSGPKFRSREVSEAATSIPSYIPIHRTWQFSPPIPADGSFSASLTFDYFAADLPDDPNFDPAKMQIISYDPSTGAFASYSTTVNLTNMTATATVNSLAAYYSLAVLGPFLKSLIDVPQYNVSGGFDTKLALVNSGSSDGHLTVTAYGAGGTALPNTPAAVTVAANHQLLESVAALGFQTTGIGISGWVQAPADVGTLTGAETIGNGTMFDALPVFMGHAASWVLTDIEIDDTYSTGVTIVNPANNQRNATLTLYSASGTVVGTYSALIQPKDTFVTSIQDIFSPASTPFVGYMVITGDGDVVASALLTSYDAIAGVAGHPLTAATGAITLLGPQLGAAGEFTRVILVNTGATDANLTLTAYTASGASAGNPVTTRLTAGTQMISDLATLFGFDASNPIPGSFTVTSDQPTVYGDLTFGDFSFAQMSRASVPLVTSGQSSLVIPYVENDSTAATTINIANPNSGAASVSVVTLNSGGTQAASATVSVPANGFVAAAAPGTVSAGYVTLNSTQPVVAFAVVAPKSGADFSAFAAVPGTGPNSGGPAPTVQSGAIVNAASFTTKMARGSLATIFGSNLSTSTGQSQTLPLATNLGGAVVTVGGIAAPLVYVSPAQINFQVPFEVPTGSANVVITAGGTSSATIPVTVADYAVGVFSCGASPCAVHNSTNQLVTSSNPAVPGEVLILYATGIGKLTTSVASGNAAPTSPLASSVDPATITLGGTSVQVLFSGLTPGLVGLAQFDIQLPSTLPSGNLPLVVALPGDSSAPVNLPVAGNGPPAAPPAISTPTGINFSSVAQGGSKQLSLTVKNTGGAPLNVTSVTAGGAFSVISSGSFSVAAGASSAVTLQFNPSSAGGQTGTVRIASNDPVHPNLTMPVWGNAYNPALVLTSDSFNRANAGECALGTSDAKFGGGTIYHYLPDWPGSGGPVGASISGGVLVNNGNNYGGAQLTTSSDTCNTARGATLAQDLDIVVDLYVPKTGANITDAGPYFRSRAAAPGDGLAGGTTSGYWVELLSTGQVLVNQLNPFQTIAQTAIPASFDSTIFHTMEARVQGAALQVTLDGTLQTFNGSSTVTVSTASNSGTVGISFGSEMNPELAGGQAAGNLVISSVGSSGGTPAISLSATTLPSGNVTSLAFGNVAVGQLPTLIVNVLNTGTAALTVSSVSISNPAFGLLTPNIPFTTQPGSTTPVSLVFAPTSAMAQTGTLTLTSNDPANPNLKVTLSGMGTGAPSNFLAYGNVVVGQSETGTLTFTNTGTTTLTVTAQTTTNAAFTVASPSTPYNIPAGQSAAIKVVFQPTAYTVNNATLSIVNGGGTLTTPLSGAGVVVQ